MQVTSADQFTTGQYYMVTDTGYAPGALDGTWISAVAEASASTDAVWTLTVDGSNVILTDANNVSVAPKGGNDNGIVSGSYEWAWSFENGKFKFSGQGDDTVFLASNKSSQNKFRGYKTSTVNGSPNSYPSEFTLYKLDGGSGEVTVAAPQADPQAGAVVSGTQVTLSCATGGAVIYYTLNGDEPSASSTQYTAPFEITGVVGNTVTLKAIAIKDDVSSAVQEIKYTIAELQDIKTALEANSGSFTVKGVVTCIDGKNVYLQDSTGAICARMSSNFSDISLGDTIIATGSRTTYNGLPQLDSSTYSKSSGLTLTAKAATIDNLTNADICTYVEITGVEVTEVYDNNGQFANPNITVKDASGKTIQLYKAVLGDKTIEVGDTLDIKAAVGVYNGTLQLRNTSPDEITVTSGGDTPEPGPTSAELAESIKAGDIVLIYYPTDDKVMSTQKYTYTGGPKDELVALDASVSDGTMSSIPASTALFKVYEKDGHLVFRSDAGFLYLDGTHVRLVEELGEYTYFDLEEAENGWFIKSTNAQYSGKPQYLEFYGGYFTCYGMNSGNSGIYTFQFYKAGEFNPADDPLPDEGETAGAPFAAGDDIVIYAPSNNMALSSTVKSQYYPVGVAVTVSDDEISGYGDTEIWTVGGDADGWTFATAEGTTLSMGGSYTSTYPGAGSNETWVLEEAETEGQFYIKNVGRGTYLWWDDEHDDWTTKSDQKTAVAFRIVERTDEPGEEVTGLEVLASPVSGAVVRKGDTIELIAAEGAKIYYSINSDAELTAESGDEYTGPLTVGGAQVPEPTSGQPLVVKALAVMTGEDGTEQAGSVYTFTYKAPDTLDGYTLYFGQLHSHTNISDGAGDVEDAFKHAAGVENLDFLAVTDHSNSFDNENDPCVDLGADLMGVSDEWKQGHDAADAITEQSNGTFVGIYGFEMTWSGGFGHINTFNTPGFESRNSDEFPNNPTGHVNYYNKLVEVEESLSQFNHPGTTFGDFADFGYYSQAYDERINLIEVGNGEGAIGQSGYFPSYEYYTRALDKGWHVAPTNNQDNHKGNWGDSNTARSVVLASELTEEAIYDAIANHRVYATEDNDLSILYSLNDNVMGSIIGEQDAIEIEAQISDPTDSADMTVEVIVNGGLVIGSKTLSGGEGTVTFNFDSNDYSYYYLRVTQADKNIAVTAPVWTGESINAGISKTECDTVLVVKDETVNISSELFNNSNLDMQVTSLVYTVGDKTIYEANVADIGNSGVISTGGTATVSFSHAFTAGGATSVEATMIATIGDTDYTFTSVLQLTVTDESLVTRVLVDGTHWNDYVTGYYHGNMGNFTELAASMNAQVTIKQPGETITASDLEDVALLVISAPLKYDGRDDLPEGATQSTFSAEFIELVANYAKNGGTVILCGLADYQDNNNGAPYCSTEQINPILEAMGSTLRLNDDEVLDDDENHNGGSEQLYRVYMTDFNTEAFPGLFAGLQEGQRYSAYSGCSVDLGTNGQAIVSGSENCYSINSKTRPAGAEGKWDSGKDKGSTADGSYDANTAVVTKGNVVTLATEAVGSGRVYVAGTVFISDFEISNSSDIDYGDASYANKTIITNILSGLLVDPEISTIAEARAGDDGDIFTVKGTVIAGSVSPNAFFDCIYIQDGTGAICLHPVNDTVGIFRVGQTVVATGYRGDYQGDVQLGQVISAEVVDSTVSTISPAEYTLAEASDYDNNGGYLAKVSGTVKSVTASSGQISTVILTDGTNDFRLLFNNYIGYSNSASPDITTFVKEGAEISAVGVIYMDPQGACLRVRDLSEVALVSAEEPDDPDEPIWPVYPGDPVRPGKPDEDDDDMPELTEPFIDVNERDWFYDAVVYVYNEGMMSGVEADVFSPDGSMTRAMFWTVLARIDGADTSGGLVWYSAAQKWAISEGVSDGTEPNALITREQLATMLWRYAGEPEGNSTLDGFTDSGSVSYWAYGALVWAVENGIVTGMGDGILAPQGTATRAQAATMFMRYMSVVK